MRSPEILQEELRVRLDRIIKLLEKLLEKIEALRGGEMKDVETKNL